MIAEQGKIFTPSKVSSEKEKIEAYLNGERFFPTTMEMDLTQLCTRNCPGCPYGASRKPGLTLQLPFMDRLFGILGPHTPGIVFSGGEPTIVPHFPEAAALARARGFKEIAVISNGAEIHTPRIQDALLRHVTAIRISMYDWQESESEHFIRTLEKIGELRRLIDRSGSRLEIGASILTRREVNHRYASVGLRALESGIHWLYFHPYCVGWETGYPRQADQTGVLEALEEFRKAAPPGSNIQVPTERYSPAPLRFERLHGSYFLIQVGADGINYAGPECKYDADAELLDLNEYLEDDFLWHPRRIRRLNELNSGNYRYIGTRHRPPVFSDYIQRIIDQRGGGKPETEAGTAAGGFYYPSII